VKNRDRLLDDLINAYLSTINSKDTMDMHLRRAVNAARSINGHDYVIKLELDELAAIVDAIVISGVVPHHTTHEQGGTDAIKLDDLATPDDNTDLNATILLHGLLRKLDGSASHFLDGTGNWSTPSVVVPDATTTTKGIVELATDGENAANVVVQGNDSRINNRLFKHFMFMGA
jgi:hypothetical protein